MKFWRNISTLFFLCFSLLMWANGNGDILSDTIPEVLVLHDRQQMMSLSGSNVPTSFSLFSIEQNQVQSPKDLSTFVPSLHMPDYGSAMTSSIYMRGLGSRIDNPVVGLYIDGVGIANKNSYDFNFLDITTVQVYRGPQGTLLGRNTIGGVISLKTISPLAYQGTRAQVSYGNLNYALAQVSHYAKLSETFGLGVGAYYQHTDGYFVNQFDGKLTDWVHKAGAMLKLEAQPTDNMRIINTLNYNFVRQGAFPYHLVDQPVNHNDFSGYQRHSLTDGLNVEIDFNDLTLSSVTTYQYLDDRMDMDQDYLPYSYFTLVQSQKEHYIEQNLTLRNTKHIGRLNPKEQDLEASERSSFAWDWLAGLTISYRQNQMSAPVTFLKQGIDSIILANANVFETAQFDIRDSQFTIYSNFRTPTFNAALYHTSYLTYNRWLVELGLRLDYEQSSFDYHSFGSFTYNFAPYLPDYRLLECNFEGESHLRYLEFLPRAAVSYRTKNWTAFASIAEGYRAGGFNSQLFADIVRNDMTEKMMQRNQSPDVDNTITYKPERCLTSEIGARYQYLKPDIDWTTEIRVYDNELFNQQLTIFPPKTTGRMMTNAGRSRSIGAEITSGLTYKNLTAYVAYGYTYARFIDYQSGANNYAGKHIPYIPDHTLSVGAAYRWAIDHDIVSGVILSGQTKAVGAIYWDNANDYVQPFYALLNMKLTVAMKYFCLSLWAQNLTNTKYNVFYFESMSNVFMQSGKPITFGGTIKFEI